jgi:MFS family permease
VVLLFLWVIYNQVHTKSELIDDWLVELKNRFPSSQYLLFLAILLMPVNIILEALKWKEAVNKIELHSTNSAILSVLSGITAGIITPARIGEYVGRLVYISPKNNWKAVWANFVCSLALNLMIIIGGIAGLLILFSFHLGLDDQMIYSLLIIAFLFSVLLLTVYFNLHWISKLAVRFKRIKLINKLSSSLSVMYDFDIKTLFRLLLLSGLRYLIFVLQYYLLLSFWGLENNPLLVLAGISSVFLIQSVIPLPPILGILARGEIALLIIGSFCDNKLLIISAAFSLWIINLAIPALLGLFNMLRINIAKTLGYDS